MEVEGHNRWAGHRGVLRCMRLYRFAEVEM